MACENCKYWKPSYAPFAHKFVMECTKEERKGQPGFCTFFRRKLPDYFNKEEHK